MSELFRLERLDDGMLKITFDLPEHRANIFNRTSLEAFAALLDQLEGEVGVSMAILFSAKSGIFIAGADVEEIFRIHSPEDAYEKSRLGQQLFERWARLPFPTMAVIQGACMGGGTEFALACTYRLATDSPRTRIGLPEVKLGVIPGWGGTQRLPRLIGLLESLPLIVSGRAVDARKAYRLHLVDEIIPHERREELAVALAREMITTGGKTWRARRRRRPLMNRLMEAIPLTRKTVFKRARQQVLKETRGHYPAPLKAIEAVAYGWDHSLSEGLEKEARLFSELAATEICKNLVRIFLWTEEIKRENGVADPRVQPRSVHRIGILGAGVMGGGIAQLAAYYNHPVRVKDIHPQALTHALAHARKLFDELVRRKKLSRREADLKMSLISTTLDYSGFGQVDLVIEAVVEDPDIKKKVFQELANHLPEKAVIASNTSAIPIGELAASTGRKALFAGFHFFNPVHRMPLLEIIRGPQTADETVATLYALAKKWGKTPIVVNDGPGFLVNRLLAPYMGEAILLLASGVPIPAIDRAMEAFGMPMGPFRLYDEVGIDVAYKAARVMQSHFGERFPENDLLEKLVESGRLGKKTGRGFYLHQQKKRRLDPEVYRFLGVSASRNIPQEHIQQRLIYLMVNEAAYCLEEGIASRPRDVDVGVIFGLGFPPFRGGLLRYADSVGIPTVHEKLTVFAREFGAHFTPAPLLNRLAEKERGFYAYFHGKKAEATP